MTGSHHANRLQQKKYTTKKAPSICTNRDCKLRRKGCKGFEGCPGFKGRDV